MPDPGTDLTLRWPLAFAIVLGCITLTVYFARAYARGERRRVRQRARDLQRDLSAFMDGKLSAAELREAMDDADTGAFWRAVESFALRLPRPEWVRFSKGLEKCRALGRERCMLQDESPWRAELAVRRLALIRSRASRTALRRTLVAGPELLRFAGAKALARYGDLRALRWILTHPERFARRTSKQWLSLLRGFGPAAFPQLAEALDLVKDTPVLERALVEALGHIGDLAACAALERRLTHADMDMRISATRALGRMRAVQCTTGLMGALKDDAWQVRAQAAWALGRAQAPLATYALTTRLADPSWWVRRHAAYALAELGQDGISALIHASEHSEDRYARDIAAEVLAGGVLKRAA